MFSIRRSMLNVQCSTFIFLIGITLTFFSARPALAALFSGLLLGLAFPGTGGFWFLAWVGLVPLLVAVRRTTPGRAARLGLLTGLIQYTLLLYWIVIVLGRYGHLEWWLTLPGLGLLVLYMSGYLALFAAVMAWAGRRGGPAAWWLAPFLWVSLDWARGWMLSGMPWQDLAYSQYRILPVLQLADLAGHHGLTFLIVLVNSLVALLVAAALPGRAGETSPSRSGDRRFPVYVFVLPVLLLAAAAITYGLLRLDRVEAMIREAPFRPVAVVQGNIPQELKWDEKMQQETLRRYDELSGRVGHAGQEELLLVWPETALPFYPDNSPLFDELLDRIVRPRQVWLLTGAPHFEYLPPGAGATGEEYRFYNSAYLLAPWGRVADRYDKQHLVPFGEYMPLRRYLPLPGPLVESIGDFTAGDRPAVLEGGGLRIGVLICFESIFPDLARRQVTAGANLLVNITNDAWFGRSSAPWQHLSMAVFRAVENRRSLARAANTGVSALIDPGGRIIESTPLFEEAARSAELPLLTTTTFFGRFGRLFPYLCLAATAALVLLVSRREIGDR